MKDSIWSDGVVVRKCSMFYDAAGIYVGVESTGSLFISQVEPGYIYLRAKLDHQS
jgi:hypothetical protein